MTHRAPAGGNGRFDRRRSARLRVWCLTGFVTCAAACSSDATAPIGPSPLLPGPPGTTAPAPAPPAPSLYRVVGLVTTEEGVPVAGAVGSVTYRYQPDRNRTASFRARDDGTFEMSLEAMPEYSRPEGVPIFGWASASAPTSGLNAGPNFQVIPQSGSDIVLRFRLSRSRTLSPGETLTLSVERESSWCQTEISNYMHETCEKVGISVPAAGTLIVTAVPLDGSEMATLRSEAHPSPQGLGTLSMQVTEGESLSIGVGIAKALAPRRFSMSMTLVEP